MRNVEINITTINSFLAVMLTFCCAIIVTPSTVIAQTELQTEIPPAQPAQPAQPAPQAPTAHPPKDFRAAAILPFFSQLIEDPEAPPARRELRMREIALEHLNGMRWASERLKAAGYHIELSFFDEVADTNGVVPWSMEDLYGIDVVFGPLQFTPLSHSIRTIERAGAEHILLTPVSDLLLMGSSEIRSVIPSEKFAVDLLAEHIAKNHLNDNVIFVMAGGSDAQLEERFLNIYNSQVIAATLDTLTDVQMLTEIFEHIFVDSLRFDTVQGTRNSVGSLPEKLKFYERNVVVTVAGRSARSMLSNLQMAVQVNDSSEIYVYAHHEIQDLGFIDTKFLNRTRTTTPISGQLNWNDSTTIEAVKLYRKLHKTDPSKYAIISHDALLDAFQRNMWDEDIDWDFSNIPSPLATEFDWKPVGKFIGYSGYVNGAWDLETFHLGNWCPTDTVPELEPFIPPQLNRGGYYIHPKKSPITRKNHQ